ncbi:hypothetical protein LguiA_012525 [Lonicera macranthoides]
MANSSSSQRQEKNKEKEDDPVQFMFESIDEKLGLKHEEKPPKKSIFQVPKKLRKFNEDSYSPRVVSIGPIHRGKSELLAVEELKWIYVESFLFRKDDPIGALEDACQLKLKFENRKVNIKEDPILNNDLMIRMLQQDLALLENQIPFIVLETLIQCIDYNRQSLLITYYALDFFSSVLNFKGEVRVNMHMEETVGESINLHLLQIIHNYYLTISLNIDESESGEKKWGFEHCAIHLYEGGVKFEKASSDHLLNIKFDGKRGVLQIPQLRVGGIESSLVRNLVAFEQCNFGTTHHMTAYVMLMRSLISSSEDVKLLKRKGILELELGSSEKDVLNYFRNIRAEIVPKDYYFDSLCRQVNEYRKSHWNLQRRRASMKVWCNKTMATMKQDYCPNPFKTMSVIAAFVLLLFTGLQTFYTVRSYYPR